MNRWRFFSITLALVIGLVALAPIHMHGWDGAEAKYLYIVKHLYDSDRSMAVDAPANSNGQTGEYDGVEAEYLDFIKKKPVNKDAVEPINHGRTLESEIFSPINKGTSQPC